MHGVKMEMAKMPDATYLDLRTEGPQITYETCLGADPRLSRGGGHQECQGCKVSTEGV